MNKRIYLLILFLFSVQSIFSQTTHIWTNTEGGIFENATNWNTGISPTTGDIIIFENFEDLLIIQQVPSISFFQMIIRGNAQVEFQSTTDLIILFGDIQIEQGAGFQVLQNIQTQIAVEQADIYGEWRYDNGNHQLLSNSTLAEAIHFHQNAVFEAGINLTDHPFGNDINRTESILFMAGSSYLHHGGQSPMGNDPMNPICVFHPESNYLIMTGDGSAVQFSGFTYGNIINHAATPVVIPSGNTDDYLSFEFHQLENYGGDIVFEGTEWDDIFINNGGLISNAGSIHLQAGTIQFTGGHNVISGTQDILLTIKSEFGTNLLTDPSSLELNRNMSVNTTQAFNIEINIAGEINCKNNVLASGDEYTHFNLDAGARVITAHPMGLNGSIPAASISLDVDIVYNGSAEQNTGILGGTPEMPVYLDSLIIDNSSGVFLDQTVDINYLKIFTGILHLGNDTVFVNDFSIENSILNSYLAADQQGVISYFPEGGGITETIPIGTSSYSAPLTISFSSAINCEFSMDAAAATSADYGNIAYSWTFEEEFPGTFENVTFSWLPDAELSDFDNSLAYIAYFDGTNRISLTSPMEPVITNGFFTLSADISAYGSGKYTILSEPITNQPPESSDGNVTTTTNTPYIFNSLDFDYYDADGDPPASLLIEIHSGETSQMAGALYFDENADAMYDDFEQITPPFSLPFNDLDSDKFVYVPPQDEVGLPLDSFYFKVQDVFQNISENLYVMNIFVEANNAPVLQNASFFVHEFAPEGTIVGKLDVTAPNGLENLSFEVISVIEGIEGAFRFDAETMDVLVNRSHLLDKSIYERFIYRLAVFDSDTPSISDTAWVTIELIESGIRSLDIANFFSPNNDGHNDVWRIKGSILDPDIEYLVFNQSGQVIFKSHGYTEQWDGLYQGRPLSPGVYYYVIRTSEAVRKGTITLVR